MSEKGKLRIMLVEHNLDHAFLMKKALEGVGGHRIEVVDSSAAALKHLAEQGCDLIILDYKMPQTDGLTVLENIQKAGYGQPAIMITGAGSEKTAVEALKKGAYDYIIKKGDFFDYLPEVVRETWQRYQRIRQKEDRLKRLEASQAALTKKLANLEDSLDLLKNINATSIQLLKKVLRPEKLQQIICQAVRDICHYERYRFYLYDNERGLLQQVGEEKMRFPSRYRQPAVPTGLMAHLIEQAQKNSLWFLHIEDIQDQDKYPFLERESVERDAKAFGADQVREVVYLVFGVGRNVSAVLAINNWETGRLLFPANKPKVVKYLRLLASQAGLALEKARLYGQRTKEARQLSALYRASASIARTLELDETLKIIVRSLREGLGYDRAGLFLVDQRNNLIRGSWGTDSQGNVEKIDHQVFPLDDKDNNLVDLALGRIDYFFSEDLYQDIGSPLLRQHIVPGTKQNVAVPLRIKGRIIGVLAVDNLLSKRPLGYEDVQALIAFATPAAAALDNAALYSRLKELEQEMADIIESDPVPTLVLDENNKIVLVNKHLEDLWRVKRKDLLGWDYLEVWPWARETGQEEIIKRVNQKGKEYQDYNTEAILPDGRRIYANIRISRRSRGGVIVILADTSEQVRLEQAMRDQAVQIEKVAMVAKLTRTMSHEINNPLTAIVCYVQILSKKIRQAKEFWEGFLPLLETSRAGRSAGESWHQHLKAARDIHADFAGVVQSMERTREQSMRIAEIIKKLTLVGEEAQEVRETDYPGGVKIVDIEGTVASLKKSKKRRRSAKNKT